MLPAVDPACRLNSKVEETSTGQGVHPLSCRAAQEAHRRQVEWCKELWDGDTSAVCTAHPQFVDESRVFTEKVAEQRDSTSELMTSAAAVLHISSCTPHRQLYNTSTAVLHITAVQQINSCTPHRQLYNKSTAVLYINSCTPHQQLYSTSTTVQHINSCTPHRQLYNKSTAVLHIDSCTTNQQLYSTSTAVLHISSCTTHQQLYNTLTAVLHISSCSHCRLQKSQSRKLEHLNIPAAHS
ncbi:hypothetical protein C0Q70_21202 [Pomacea canaliculata]|uniref:Uncharacterized protein n=1 Tax=Pomacea canaliculata TaxID=400727 RepID=A0A2T7NBY2_POMCA|nr:hypothetical protein C0Q70_21202 [Pomacea canaliculata]